MKNNTKSAIELGIVGSIAGILTFVSQAMAVPPTDAPRGPMTSAASATPAVASAQLAADLAWMRDEERLARDVYTALAARYDGALPFANIAKSEQQHYAAVGTLLTRYGVADPSAGRAAGSYSEPELQALYDQLIAQGNKSLTDAYAVGVAVEKTDIADLKKALGETKETDVIRVFTNLLRASETHLAAFTAAASGETVGVHDGTGMQGRAGQGAAGRGFGQGGTGQRMGPGNGTGACVNP